MFSVSCRPSHCQCCQSNLSDHVISSSILLFIGANVNVIYGHNPTSFISKCDFPSIKSRGKQSRSEVSGSSCSSGGLWEITGAKMVQLVCQYMSGMWIDHQGTPDAALRRVMFSEDHLSFCCSFTLKEVSVLHKSSSSPARRENLKAALKVFHVQLFFRTNRQSRDLRWERKASLSTQPSSSE